MWCLETDFYLRSPVLDAGGKTGVPLSTKNYMTSNGPSTESISKYFTFIMPITGLGNLTVKQPFEYFWYKHCKTVYIARKNGVNEANIKQNAFLGSTLEISLELLHSKRGV